MVRQPKLTSLASAILSSALTLVSAQEDCYPQFSPNLLVNPSFENGLTGWTNSLATSVISTAEASNGETCL